MTTTIYFNQGSYQFNSLTTPLSYHLEDIKVELKKAYNYNPNHSENDNLWAQVLEDGKEIARFEYNGKSDELTAITWIKLEDFKMYCIEHGIYDAAVTEDRHSFYCQSKIVRMTSFLSNKFTQWCDLYNANKKYVGYTFRLAKVDLHNANITQGYFKGKL